MVVLHQLFNDAVTLSHRGINNSIADDVITATNVGVLIVDGYVLLVFAFACLSYRDDGRVDVLTVRASV